jgi:DNA repair protein RecN (Recombination protein N)
MLTRLHIKNFALIDEVELEFGAGFNVLTGETGAGKSILIDAINVVLGGRAGPEWLRTGADRASIEAVFEVAEGGGQRAEGSYQSEDAEPAALSSLPSALSEWSEDGLLILSRELTRTGKSQCRVNGRLCTASTVREVAGELIDIHGQHEHQSLLHPERHVDLLDAWAGAPVLDLRRRAEAEYAEWRRARQELEAMRTDERDRARQLDLYQFQIEEIDAAQLGPGEEEELLADRSRLANAEKLYAAAAGALQALGEGNVSALDLLSSAAREVEAAAGLDTSLADAAEALETAVIAAQEAASELRSYQESVEFNPERLEQVQERLDLLRTLKRKYGDTLEEVLQYRERIGQELHALTHHEERLVELEAELTRRTAAMDTLAQELYVARRAAAVEFERRLVTELRDLNMQHTVFEVRMEEPGAGTRAAGGREASGVSEDDEGEKSRTDASRLTPHAWFPRIEFLISPNPGEPVRPLARIASGGEMSRVMLALKSAMAGVSGVPTLIFDEVDAGVGGRTAEVLGEKMAALAHSAQVLCVTHLPQIAGMASRHFRVQKQVAGERTLVEVTALEEGDRVPELARMLGGKEETAARHARELLANGAGVGREALGVGSESGEGGLDLTSPAPNAQRPTPNTQRPPGSKARRRA